MLRILQILNSSGCFRQFDQKISWSANRDGLHFVINCQPPQNYFCSSWPAAHIAGDSMISNIDEKRL